MRLFRYVLLAIVVLSAAPGFARSLERDVLEEINFARTQPQQYADELRQYRDRFDGRIVADEIGEHMTYEGVRAVDEAIAFLDAQTPLEPLAFGTVLARAAADYATDQGQRGSMGHVSANGMSPGRRVSARGGGPYVSETIAYGRSDVAGIVRSLIVDDGVRSRIHRAIIFQSYLQYAGVGCGPHTRAEYVCVIDYAQTADGGIPRAPKLARSEFGDGEDMRQPF
jgi:uncharacterized protein YkwD